MSHHSKSVRQQSSEHRAIAQTYATRIVIGKLVLVLAGSASLAVVVLLGSMRSAGALGVGVFGCACVVAACVGDFPALVHCPGCGQRMRVRVHQDPHPYKRYRYLECPHCHQTVALAVGSAFRPGR